MRLGAGGPWSSIETSNTALDFLTLSYMLTPSPSLCCGGQEDSGTQLLSTLIGILGYLLLWKPVFLSTEESSRMAGWFPVCEPR